jgi:hypothetical protein
VCVYECSEHWVSAGSHNSAKSERTQHTRAAWTGERCTVSDWTSSWVGILTLTGVLVLAMLGQETVGTRDWICARSSRALEERGVERRETEELTRHPSLSSTVRNPYFPHSDWHATAGSMPTALQVMNDFYAIRTPHSLLRRPNLALG